MAQFTQDALSVPFVTTAFCATPNSTLRAMKLLRTRAQTIPTSKIYHRPKSQTIPVCSETNTSNARDQAQCEDEPF